MTAVRNWLEAIGLPQYGEAFETNEIDMDLLAQVDDQTLKDIGISIAGHRLRIRSATTRRLTGGLFEYRDLGTVALKGLGANVPAWGAGVGLR
jgi:SAM (Sterile alpha motif) domain-containing protein